MSDEREIRKQGLIATAGLIRADREAAELPLRLASTLKLAQQLLTNQMICEQSLCDSCNKSREVVLEAVNETLEAARKAGV